MRSIVARLCAVLILIILAGCVTAPPTRPSGNATVVWISIDGLRSDYIARAQPPTLARLIREGAFTNQLRPSFPSETFPNHITQATGVPVARHGIVMNDFIDRATGQKYSFPNDSSLIRAEPIWVTAKRQGVRVAVIDWPMSHASTGEFKSDYSGERFDPKETDDARLQRVVKILNDDHRQPLLRLVMSYISRMDHDGHKFGPDAPEIAQGLRETDEVLGRFVRSVTEWFDATHPRRDQLYLLLTTDHGMAGVHTQVNLDRLIGADLLAGAKILTSGPLAQIYLTDVPADERPARASAIIAKLHDHDFVTAWPGADVPKRLRYSDATRLGDIVVLLSPGYTFTTSREAATRPAVTGFKGVHGYDPAVCPEILGTAIIWHYRHNLHGRDLGPIDNTQWHATVTELLRIAPGAGSDRRAIQLPQP